MNRPGPGHHGPVPDDFRQDALETVRVTSDRVRRYTAAVEEDPSEECRRQWRAALDHLRSAIRAARAAGVPPDVIREAAAAQPTGRFLRADEAAEPTAA